MSIFSIYDETVRPSTRDMPFNDVFLVLHHCMTTFNKIKGMHFIKLVGSKHAHTVSHVRYQLM
jgi:hypothetical protein